MREPVLQKIINQYRIVLAQFEVPPDQRAGSATTDAEALTRDRRTVKSRQEETIATEGTQPRNAPGQYVRAPLEFAGYARGNAQFH